MDFFGPMKTCKCMQLSENQLKPPSPSETNRPTKARVFYAVINAIFELEIS